MTSLLPSTALKLLWAPLLVGLALTSACAGRASDEPPAVPATSPSPEATAPAGGGSRLSELEALEHDLEVSERRLDEHLVAGAAVRSQPLENTASGAGAEPTPDASSEAAADEAPVTRPPPAPAPEKSRRERARADDVCTLSCRALASMRRAALGICKIAPGDPRCPSATERVERAAKRVTTAGCGCAE